MKHYGIIKGEAELVQTPNYCTWKFKRYESDGSVKEYIGFEASDPALIPESGEVLENFNEWRYRYAPDEL